MFGLSWFNTLLAGVFIAAAISFVLLLKVDAPYGHAQRPGWGPVISNRWGWVLMELPAYRLPNLRNLLLSQVVILT